MVKYIHFLDFLRITANNTKVVIYYDLNNTDCILFDGIISDITLECEEVKNYLNKPDNFIRLMKNIDGKIALYIL